MPDTYNDIVEAIKTGFAQATFDMRNAAGDVGSAGKRAYADVSVASNQALGISARLDRGFGAPNNFINRTFDRHYNQPNSWSRDALTLLGRESVDVSRVEAQERARRAWAERGEKIGLGSASLAAMAIPGAFLPTLAFDFIGAPIINRGIERKYEYAAWADVTGRYNVTAGKNAESPMGGWSSKQEMEIGGYLKDAHKGTGFKAKELAELTRQLDKYGAFKTFDQTSVSEFERKFSTAIENTKNAMKFLKVTQEGAAKIVGEMNTMKINPNAGINRLSVAAAYTGLPAAQVFEFSKNIGGAYSSMFGISEGAGVMAGMDLLTKPLGDVKPEDYVSSKVSNLQKLSNQKAIFAAFWKRNKNGKIVYDEARAREYVKTKDFAKMYEIGIANMGMVNTPEEMIALTSPDLLTKYGMKAETVQNLADTSALAPLLSQTTPLNSSSSESDIMTRAAYVQKSTGGSLDAAIQNVKEYYGIQEKEQAIPHTGSYVNKRSAKELSKGAFLKEQLSTIFSLPGKERKRIQGLFNIEQLSRDIKKAPPGILNSLYKKQAEEVFRATGERWDAIGTNNMFVKNRVDVLSADKIIAIIKGAGGASPDAVKKFMESREGQDIFAANTDKYNIPTMGTITRMVGAYQLAIDENSKGLSGGTKTAIKGMLTNNVDGDIYKTGESVDAMLVDTLKSVKEAMEAMTNKLSSGKK